MINSVTKYPILEICRKPYPVWPENVEVQTSTIRYKKYSSNDLIDYTSEISVYISRILDSIQENYSQYLKQTFSKFNIDISNKEDCKRISAIEEYANRKTHYFIDKIYAFSLHHEIAQTIDGEEGYKIIENTRLFRDEQVDVDY